MIIVDYSDNFFIKQSHTNLYRANDVHKGELYLRVKDVEELLDNLPYPSNYKRKRSVGSQKTDVTIGCDIEKWVVVMPLREPMSLRGCVLLRGSRRLVSYDGCTHLMRPCMATAHGIIAQECTNKGRTLLFNLNMITEDYVSFEIAKLLKEKGFDGECFHTYFDDEYHIIAAPTIQMAMKWLRQKNDIAIEINVGSGSKDCWVSNVIKDYKTENGTYIQTFVKFSYEEACGAAIRYILENLI